MTTAAVLTTIETPPGLAAALLPSARLPAFMGCRVDAAPLLRALRVALVGCGSVGGRIADSLARLGVDALWLIDPKQHKAESLLTHSIDPDQVGQSKAISLGRRCKRLSPATQIAVFEGPVQQLPIAAFAEAHLVALASDNLSCEAEAGQRCLSLSRPLVQGAVHGESLTAAVRFFANGPSGGPCPRCLFGEAEVEALKSETRFSCEPRPAGVAPAPAVALPTFSVGSLCSLAADLVVIQILRYVLGLGEPVGDTLLMYNGYTHRTDSTRIRRNPACPSNHQAWRIRTSPRPLAECAPVELFALAGCSAESGCAIGVDGLVWVEAAKCQCPEATPLRRFHSAGQPWAEGCPICHGRRVVSPFFSHAMATVGALGPDVHRPLGQLGAGAATAVLIQDAGGSTTLIRSTNPARHPTL